MAKNKTKRLPAKPVIVDEVKKVSKPVFKSRFSGLVKVDAGQSVPDATVREIEGEKYLEFDGLKGVFFSAKLFV